MEVEFHDISKYFSANVYDNMLSIGKIVSEHGQYVFAKDDVHGPYNLIADLETDIAQMVSVIGEIHPANALADMFDISVTSCLYLNENTRSGEIEVRSIHKGIGESIYSRKECPLILWNPNYLKDGYFDVIDIQNVFQHSRLKDNFSGILAESLRELELFPPLVHIKKPF